MSMIVSEGGREGGSESGGVRVLTALKQKVISKILKLNCPNTSKLPLIIDAVLADILRI